MTEPWLDKSKLEEWLHSPVTDCIRTDAELKGDNYLSDLHRLLVKTKDGDKALIVKCPLEDSIAATALKETTIFRKEECMYGHTLTGMDELIKSVLPEDVEPFAPKCFYSCESFLVMEDLSASGYKMLNRREGLNLEQCLALIRTIARFHAASVALVEENPEAMKGYELLFFDETSIEHGWRKYFPAMIDLLIEELKTWPQDEWSVYIEKLRPLREDFLDRLRKVTRPEESGCNVLVHGDLWTNNMLFRGLDVRLIDFQLVQYTSPTIDLHLFLNTSPNLEVRDHHIDTLIKEMCCDTTPGWLDKNFLGTALGGGVAKFEAKSLGNAKDFFTSTLYRAVVELKSGKKEYLIIKKLNAKQGDELYITDTTIFHRETHMYSVVMPKLVSVLQKAFPDMEPIAPKHFYSTSGVIVLEDLSVSGFRMLDRIQGLNLGQCLEVMRMLGRFHGASVILYEQDPDLFDPYLISLFAERPMRELQKNLYKSIPKLLAEDIVDWPGFGERYSKKLREMADHMQEFAINSSRRQNGRYNVLTHDDIWVCNLLFREPHGVRLIDFQMPHYASLGNDLQTFFTSSLEPDVRRNHIDTLLKEYHKDLHETLALLGYKKKLPTFEDVYEEYIKSAAYAFALCVVHLPSNYVTADLDIPVFDPNATQPDRTLYEGTKYRETMQELMRVFEEQGAFTID